MATESESNLRLKIGHVLFIDLVGYSKLLIEEQKERQRQLTDILLATAQVAARRTRNSFDYRLVTGWRWSFGIVRRNRRNAHWKWHGP